MFFLLKPTQIPSGQREHAGHEEIDLYVRSFGPFFRIRYNRNFLGNSSLYSSFLNSLRILRGDNEKECAEEVERLKKDFEPLMIELAPQLPVSTDYLHDFLYPQRFVLNAAAAQDMTLQPQCEKTIWRDDIDFPGGYIIPRGRECLLDLLKSVGLYSSRHVRLLPSPSEGKLNPYLRGPGKVSVGDTTCYFKAWKPGRGKHGATYHELRAYQMIEKAVNEKKLPHDIRISRLHGAVVDCDNEIPQHFPNFHPTEHNLARGNRLVGILLTYVEIKGTLSLTAPWSDITEDCRLRWAVELEVLIRTLHSAGLVWGDAKPHNVLVDTRDNLWLIDFGGSFTQGWVDEENRDTKEGDLQALERIKAWLVKCSKNPVHKIVHTRRQ